MKANFCLYCNETSSGDVDKRERQLYIDTRQKKPEMERDTTMEGFNGEVEMTMERLERG